MATTDTTAVTELVNSEVINSAILEYAHAYTAVAQFVNQMDLRGKGSNVGSFPKWVLDAATDITNETTSLGSTLLETTDVSITGAEIGVRRDITDAVLESTVIGAQIFDFLVRDAGVLFGISLDADLCALFSGFSTNVGTSGANLTLANMVEAQSQIRANGHRGSLAYILDTQQASDYQAAQASATGTQVAEFFTVSAGIDSGYLGSMMGHPVWTSGSCPTANTAADVVGACIVDGQKSPSNAALGMVLTRDITTELQRDASERLTEFVATAKWGVGEISDLSGTAIITDA
jgi:hypothetical protein